MVCEAIKGLVQYGINAGLLKEEDRIYATNQILDVLKLDEYEEPEGTAWRRSLRNCWIMPMSRGFWRRIA